MPDSDLASAVATYRIVIVGGGVGILFGGQCFELLIFSQEMQPEV
jgi:hypothetical protein